VLVPYSESKSTLVSKTGSQLALGFFHAPFIENYRELIIHQSRLEAKSCQTPF